MMACLLLLESALPVRTGAPILGLHQREAIPGRERIRRNSYEERSSGPETPTRLCPPRAGQLSVTQQVVMRHLKRINANLENDGHEPKDAEVKGGRMIVTAVYNGKGTKATMMRSTWRTAAVLWAF